MKCAYDEQKYGTLDRTVAKFGNPIRSAEQLPAPLSTQGRNADWDARNRGRFWWADEASIKKELKKSRWMNSELLTLHKKLLSFGGAYTVLPIAEIDLYRILERGQLWLGDNSKMVRGQPSQCHRNSGNLWAANKMHTIICTGYALSEDGMWRQHSWLWDFTSQQIVETTEPRIAYFGFAMTHDEAEKFSASNH